MTITHEFSHFPLMLTPEKTAELLGVKTDTLAVWRCTNRYPGLTFVRVGRKIMYRSSAVARWLDSRTVAQEVNE